MHTLARSLNKDDDRLQFYGDQFLGPASKAAQGDWAIRRDHLKILSDKEKWQDLFDICDALLSGARANNDAGHVIDTRGSDWLVWTSYIGAANKLQTSQSVNPLNSSKDMRFSSPIFSSFPNLQ